MAVILLVEDEKKLAQAISDELVSAGYEVITTYDGNQALEAMDTNSINLALLDINIPGINGIELCKRFRQRIMNLPIIMTTAFSDLDTKMIAFQLGADDYIVKPFHLKELVAKVRVFLRRADSVNDNDLLNIKDLEINRSQKRVQRAGNNVDLTPKEFAILDYLVAHAGRIVTKDELINHVWSGSFGVTHNAVEVYINFLRNKIDKPFDKKLIQTKPGYGYYIDTQ